MKIALLGYGKMGKAIEKIALKRGHQIVLKVDTKTPEYDITKCDIAIDFSTPKTAFSNILNCINNHIPIVSGTTGWLTQFNDITELCNKNKGAFIYASNFSLGVNIFFELNEYLAKMMRQLKEYQIDIEEIHHTKKLDKPSGTAITLAEGIIKNSTKNKWVLDKTATPNEIPITAKRIENVPGTHTVQYNSNIDCIEIKHTAHSRDGFAIGAIIAAEWLVNKTGVYTMKDVLDLN